VTGRGGTDKRFHPVVKKTRLGTWNSVKIIHGAEPLGPLVSGDRNSKACALGTAGTRGEGHGGVRPYGQNLFGPNGHIRDPEKNLGGGEKNGAKTAERDEKLVEPYRFHGEGLL